MATAKEAYGNVILKRVWALTYSAFRYPTKTTIIDKGTGEIIGHFTPQELKEYKSRAIDSLSQENWHQ